MMYEKVERFSVETYLKCKVCFKVAVSPIYSCETGHILCGICYETVKKCRVCQKKVSLNGLAENILKYEGIQLPCRNEEFGCSLKIVPIDMKKHLMKCDFQSILCKEPSPACDKKGYDPKQLFLHWKDFHNIEKVVGNAALNSGNSEYIFRVHRKLLLSILISEMKEGRIFKSVRTFIWPIRYFEINDATFFTHVVCFDGIIYAWVTFLGTEAEANMYKYDLKFVSLEEQNSGMVCLTKIRMHCMQYYNIDKIKETGNCATMCISTLKWFTVLDEAVRETYSFVLKIDVSKMDGGTFT